MDTIKIGRTYGRFSSKPQEKGDSLRRQTVGAANYAAKNNIEIITEPYFDQGVSGKAGANLEKELGRLLSEAKSGELLLVEKLDRLGRQNPFAIGHLIYGIVQRGIEIHVWQDNQIINAENIEEIGTQFSVFTGGAVGHNDNKGKMKRLNDTFAKSLELAGKGIPTANLTKCLPQAFVWNDAIKKFDVIPEIKKIIHRIFTEYNSGLGKTSIVQGLNIDGVPTLYKGTGQIIGTKKPWLETTIKKVLKNKSYNGTLIIKGIAYEGLIEKIVSDEVFNKAQMLLVRHAGRHGKYDKGSRTNNLFAGIAKCKYCGGTINVNVCNRRNGNGSLYYYRCKNARLKSCTHPHALINAEYVEYGFFKTLFGKNAASLLKKDDRNIIIKENIEITNNQINKVKTSIANLFDMVEAGDKEAKERINKRRIELDKLQSDLIKLQAELTEDNQFDSQFNIIYKMITLDDIWASKKEMLPLSDLISKDENRKTIACVLPVLFSKIEFDCTNESVQVFKKDGKLAGEFNVKEMESEVKSMSFPVPTHERVTEFEPPNPIFTPRSVSRKRVITVENKTSKDKVKDYLSKQ